MSAHGEFRTGELVRLGINANLYTHDEARLGKPGSRTTKQMLALVLGNDPKLLASVVIFLSSHTSLGVYCVHPSWIDGL